MTEAENEALLARYVQEVWNQGNPAAVTRFAAPGYRRHQSATREPLDTEGQIRRLEGFRGAFPDVTITVEDVVSRDDLIAFRSIMRGTHRGEFMGIPATGHEITVSLLDVIRVEGGRFSEQWGGPDMLDLLRQLGGSVTAGA